MTISNVPNLNADELSAYASAKHISGVSDDEIREGIIRMLKDDGWKDAAITPMINEIARRTTSMAETTEPPSSPPKVAQDTTVVMITQLLGMLALIASRLEALEQRPAYP
jgi:hypothetical protein